MRALDGGRAGGGPSASACSDNTLAGSEEGSDDVEPGNARKRRGLLPCQPDETRVELLPLSAEEVGGTLRDGRIVVQPSGLGPNAGLGLFAGRKFVSGEVITSYSGPIIYREQVDAHIITDTS